ncbi:MAG: ATP-dependent 6-phosphofructokinase [Bacteroidetes bacterium]|nr:ATP-dependent 6-phosphofructokinase [Bacteroidota bacterium]MCW5896885.1 ATP-dependent 6-phosphofructokinase [Bacteroidota bacterium]
MKLKRIGILTGGGDCPGLNAVIRSVAKPAMAHFNATVIGILDGYEGMVEGRHRELTPRDVTGIINMGGTILGTSNKGDPFHFPMGIGKNIRIVDASQQVIEHYRDLKLDVLITIGGDGTQIIADKFSDLGLNVVGVPKTIDNDLDATDITFGHDSARAVATEAIDRLQTTASAHHRVMVVETMGRYAGWIALGAGVAGGADIILIPEIPFHWDKLFEAVLKRSKGAKFSIVSVAEGAKPFGGDISVKAIDNKRTDPVQLGGIGEMVAKRIEEETGLETRVTVLGHVQRGGSPTAYDRILATRFGTVALEAASRGEFGVLSSLRQNRVVTVPLKDAVGKQRLVPPDGQLVFAARAVGTCMGD